MGPIKPTVIYIDAKTVSVYFWLRGSGNEEERLKRGMMLREKNGQSSEKKNAGSCHNPFHPRASAGSARGSRKPPETSDRYQLEPKGRAPGLTVLRSREGP